MIHNPRTCNAFHSACENVRDVDPQHAAQYGPTAVTLAHLDEMAEEYVRDEMSECTCEAAIQRAETKATEQRNAAAGARFGSSGVGFTVERVMSDPDLYLHRSATTTREEDGQVFRDNGNDTYTLIDTTGADRDTFGPDGSPRLAARTDVLYRVAEEGEETVLVVVARTDVNDPVWEEFASIVEIPEQYPTSPIIDVDRETFCAMLGLRS